MKKLQRTNVAVWKSMLRNLPKEEFTQYALLFNNQMQAAAPKSAAYFYYFNLFTWCKHHYQRTFCTSAIQQPNLFS